MSPLLNLWRLVCAELKMRGGLHRYDDEHQLQLSWQNAHLRASKRDSFCQKRWRRGNYVADWTCNQGRLLHADDVRCNRCIGATQL